MSEKHGKCAAPEPVPGFSRAGHFGEARGTRAAMAGTYGRAILTGSGGVTMVGDSGCAIAGDRAVAVSRGPDCLLSTGTGGIAFSPHRALELCAGDEGLVIATKPAGRVKVGRDAIVVLTNADVDGPIIEAGSNSLVIKRHANGSALADVSYLIAMPGQAGFQMGKSGLMRDGVVIDCDTDPETYQRYLLQHNQELENQCIRSIDQKSINSIEVTAEILSAPQPGTVPTRDWIDPVSHPRKLILCNRAPRDARFAAGSLIAMKWDADPRSPDGIFGLLWGVGDPAAAGLGYGEDWVLVAVPSYVVTGLLDDRGHPRAVKFRAGLIVEEGSNGDLLRRLIELGIQPDRLAGEVRSAGDGGHAKVGAHGAARAGDGGWAIAGRNGQADVGENGFAEAGAYGVAKAGPHGIAVCEADGTAVAGPSGVAISHGKRYGTAAAGCDGLAVGDGRFKTVTAGAGGAALSTSYGCRVTAGDEGVAVGWGDISAGCNGVAVAFDGTLSGGEGCLMVGCIYGPDGTRRFVSAVAGQDGYVPGVRYSVQDGALRPNAKRAST